VYFTLVTCNIWFIMDIVHPYHVLTYSFSYALFCVTNLSALVLVAIGFVHAAIQCHCSTI
jgi:hypothetical protein